MTKTVKIINTIVFFAWAALIALLLYRNYTGAALAKQTLKGSIDKATYWYDIYAGPKKIGFASTTTEKVGDEIIIRNEREMKVLKDGKERILQEGFKSIGDSRRSVKFLEYTSHFKDEKGIKATGEVDDENILFFLESAEKRKTFRTPTKGRDFYLPTTFVPALVQKDPAIGSAFTIPVLDFSNLSINDLRVVLEEIRPIKVGALITILYKFRAGNAVWWSNEKGVIVKEESPSGITVYLQIERFAKEPSDRILFDYTALPFFEANKVIENIEKLSQLKVRIKGFPFDAKLYENSLVKLKDDILIIKKEDPEEMKKKSFTLPYKEDAWNSYLKADEWVRSDDKNVKGNALNMATIEEKDAYRLTRYLTSNLYFTVSAMPLFVLSNSLDIFQSRAGDYLERTVMFASFARAAGLPTRLVAGFVYFHGYFYFHAWPEVWFDRWIPVDPTLSEFPADATHIPLREGTLKNITSFVDGLKGINIEILEAL